MFISDENSSRGVKGMKKKKIGILLAMMMCTVAGVLPVHAGTSYLDVQAGDQYSYPTYKDTGTDFETYYYVTPTTYVGNDIMGRSFSVDGKYSSTITIMYNYPDKYSYEIHGPQVVGGIYYRNGKWQDRTYEPKVGDIIFFDWEGDGTTDHVGIVEKCENGTVYTVEGNSGDACKQRQYAVGSSNIYGYGIPAY